MKRSKQSLLFVLALVVMAAVVCVRAACDARRAAEEGTRAAERGNEARALTWRQRASQTGFGFQTSVREARQALEATAAAARRDGHVELELAALRALRSAQLRGQWTPDPAELAPIHERIAELREQDGNREAILARLTTLERPALQGPLLSGLGLLIWLGAVVTLCFYAADARGRIPLRTLWPHATAVVIGVFLWALGLLAA